MLNADRAPYFESCPRCGEGGLEKFDTHSYCVGCNYNEGHPVDELLSIPAWALTYLKTAKVKSIINGVRALRKREEDALAI